MNKVIIYIFIIFLKIIIYNSVYSQDTTKPKTEPVTKKDTAYVQNFILADHNYQYINKTSPDTLTRRRFLWYPAKSLEDIFNYVPGYYTKFMDIGQLNPLNYNQQSYSRTGFFRNGRPINDEIDGSIDFNLFSRNEISEIEFSGDYGNNIYGYSNTINVIQRQLFQYRPYTEFSFYQDRYENLYFDGNFHQNFFRSLNFNFGITKHSYDGHYTNSDFDKWLGRFNLTFAPGNKLNFFAYVNYAKIQKGLNSGIDPDTVNLGDKGEVFDETEAFVFNSDAYEIKERFDIDLGTIFKAGKNSTSLVHLFISNSFRKYRDEENRVNPNGIYESSNYHWINYGIKLKEQLKFHLSRDLELYSNTEGEFNFTIRNYNYSYGNDPFYMNSKNINILQEITLKLNELVLSGFVRGYSDAYDYSNYTAGFNSISITPGAKAEYNLNFTDKENIKLKLQYSYKDNHISSSAGYKNNFMSLGAEFYYYKTRTYEYYFTLLQIQPSVVFRGVNLSADFKLFKFKLGINHSYSFRNEFNMDSPENYGRINFDWEDNAFKNKLEYKIGIGTRYWSEYRSLFYSGISNAFQPFNVYTYNQSSGIRIPANATLDFYIIGKIGKATFGLTFENILDRIIYNTGVYPFMDRGGFLNSMSRFNITWNFFD